MAEKNQFTDPIDQATRFKTKCILDFPDGLQI